MTERESAYGLILEEATRAVSDQQSAVDALHARAGVVASAAALLASVVLNQELGANVGLRLALVCYLLVALLAGYVLWPRRSWRFHFRASRLQWMYLEGAELLSLSLMKRDLALHFDRYFEHNAAKIDRMSWAFAAALAFLLLGTAGLVYDHWS